MSSPTPPTTSEAVETRVTDLVDQLVRELRGSHDHRRVRSVDSLERDLGISSLERVELLVRLEQEFGVRLGDAAMLEANTAGDLVQAVAAAGPPSDEPMRDAVIAPAAATTVPNAVPTLIDALEWHASRTPDRVHIHLREDDTREIPLTYGWLWQASVAVANGLVARGIGRRETVAIMLRTELAFFTSFIGTLLAGCVPVPLYPPVRADRIEEYAQRQVGILRNADTRLMITFAEVERVASLLIGRAPSLTAVVTEDTLAEQGSGVQGEPNRGRRVAAEPALIQYTSGSTGNPKGVLLSHANLLANIRALQQGLAVQPDDVGVSWLPLYHDMGLIGAWLGTLYYGTPLVLLSPMAFLARPIRWLRALHDHRATVSPAPNFAYDICSQRIHDDELEGLDLSSVRSLLNGSEAVHPETLERFATRFAPYGLRSEALCPVYGLAECAVGLTAPPPGRGPLIDRIERFAFQSRGRAVRTGDDDHTALRFVACGQALPSHALRVVDAAGVPVANRQEGRVQFRGPSATAGYYRDREATRELVGPDGWLETGDLGYLADGDLFLTGREKDLIIKGGRNLHPHEAEEIAGAVDGVRAGCVAAFGIADQTQGTERFAIVAETRRTASDERAQLQAVVTDRVTEALGVPPDLVVMTPPGSVLKTSSGKIRRAETRERYLAGRLHRPRPAVLAQWVRLVAQSALARVRRAGIGLLRVLYTAYVALLLLVTSPLVWTVLAIGPPGHWTTRLVGSWTRVMLAVSGCPVDLIGRDRVAGLSAAVWVANHASYLDPVLVMAVLPVRLRFAAKGQLARYPLLGTAIRKGQHIRIEKSDLSQRIAGASAVVVPLRKGESLFMFPEGTFTVSPGLLPFRLGAFRAAVETGRPVVPVAISGTRRIFPADTLLLRPGRITVTIGQPLMPVADDWKEIVRLRDAARAAIEETLQERTGGNR